MSESRIFICYRREDSVDLASDLRDALGQHFGMGAVFIDLDLEPGAFFRQDITRRLNSSAVVLVVIGPEWLSISDRRRIAGEVDYVRLEIVTALNNGTPIVPLLVRGAAMPSSEALKQVSPDLERLADRNAMSLADDRRWGDAIGRLIRKIEGPPAPVDVTPPPPPLPRRGTALGRRRSVVAVVVLALVAVAILLVSRRGDEPLTIYSSLPQEEQRPPGTILSDGSGHDLSVATSRRTEDMQDAIKLALKQSERKAGRFAVAYQPLDASDDTGASPAELIQANARRVADDEHAVAYIGDFNSGSSQESMPILNSARVAQISPASTRVGLTTRDPRGDIDEPARYHPPQPGYPMGFRNFVRIIPRDTVQARALVAVMKQRWRCKKVAMIDDDSPYGQALANNIRASGRGRVRFTFSESVGPFGQYDHLVERLRREPPGCFIYSGSRNPNTVELFEAVNGALPKMRLFITDGGVAPSFYNPDDNGISNGVASRSQVMVPPRDDALSARFAMAFAREYQRQPDPYAVYGYEAMRLALLAITRSGTGKREDVSRALFGEGPPDSALGSYSIDVRGDTSLTTYGVSGISQGELRPRPAPHLHRLVPSGSTGTP